MTPESLLAKLVTHVPAYSNYTVDELAPGLESELESCDGLFNYMTDADGPFFDCFTHAEFKFLCDHFGFDTSL